MKMGKLEKIFVNSEKHARGNITIIKRVFNHLNIDSVREVLEIGCGTGNLSHHLADKYHWHVTGSDVDPEQIQVAKFYYGENKNLHFQVAEATAIPLASHQFDMILLFKALHHIPGWEMVLKEVQRLLLPGGFFIWNDLTFSPMLMPLARLFSKKYGVYTFEAIGQITMNMSWKTIYTEPPKGFIIRHHTVVFKKPALNA